MITVYRDHADFLWRTLFRMGISEPDLPDAMQEVLLVVHRRLASFDGRSKLTTWLYGVCLRVTSNLRRGRRRRRETPLGGDTDELVLVHHDHPEHLMARRDARKRLTQALGALDPEKRSLLVMFELEAMSTEQIAELLGIPLGTVHSRLHTARRLFQQALFRLEARERHLMRVSGGDR